MTTFMIVVGILVYIVGVSFTMVLIENTSNYTRYDSEIGWASILWFIVLPLIVCLNFGELIANKISKKNR